MHSTATQPLPVIVHDTPVASSVERRRIRPGTLVVCGVVAVAAVWTAFHWATVVSVLVAVLLGTIALLVFVALLLRLVLGPGNRAGWAVIGAAVAAVVLRRRR